MKINNFLFLVIIFFLTSINSKSQICDKCDNPLIPWEGELTMMVEGLYPATVTYFKKFCNGIWYIKITSINTNTGGDMVQAHNTILFNIITKNPMLLPPFTSQEPETEWRIIRPVCWQYVQYSNNQLQTPCTDDCCLTVVKAKKKDNCGLLTSIVDETGTPADCELIVNQNGSCVNTCIPTFHSINN